MADALGPTSYQQHPKGTDAMTRTELIANAAIWIGGVTFSLGVWIGAWMAIYGWAVQP
jgi:hypothetical protein